MRKDNSIAEILLAFVSRNLLSVLITIAIGSSLGLLYSYSKEELFESHSEINIDKRFFAISTVQDVFSDVISEDDRKAAIHSIVKEALSKEFLDILGEKHDLFAEPVDGPSHSEEREKLKQTLVFIVSESGSVRISTVARGPSDAQEILKDVIERIRNVMKARSVRTFQSIRDALVKELNRIAQDSLDEAQIHLANRQIAHVDSDLKSLVANEDSVESQPTADSKGEAIVSAGKDPLFGELIQKLSNLRISISLIKSEKGFVKVIDEPTFVETPVSPDRFEYLRYGFALSLIAALLQTILSEYRRMQFYSPEEIAEVLGVKFLGELPSPPLVEWRYLLEASKILKEQKLLD